MLYKLPLLGPKSWPVFLLERSLFHSPVVYCYYLEKKPCHSQFLEGLAGGLKHFIIITGRRPCFLGVASLPLATPCLCEMTCGREAGGKVWRQRHPSPPPSCLLFYLILTEYPELCVLIPNQQKKSPQRSRHQPRVTSQYLAELNFKLRLCSKACTFAAVHALRSAHAPSRRLCHGWWCRSGRLGCTPSSVVRAFRWLVCGLRSQPVVGIQQFLAE